MVKNSWFPVLLVVIFLLFVGFFALTQEAEEDSDLDEFALDDIIADFSEEDREEGEYPPEWEPPGPPRWFRSNAGGMMLEEIPSHLVAIRNKYALVIDYAPPDEIEPRLMPYYQNDYSVEVRVLYEQRRELRRQWLFRDESGVVRLNAVFVPPAVEQPVEQLVEQLEERPELQLEEQIEPDAAKPQETEIVETEIEETEITEAELATMDLTDMHEVAETWPAETELAEGELGEIAAESPSDDGPVVVVKSMGFIELFNEKTQITEERQFFDDDSEVLIIYFYNNNILVKAEAQQKRSGEEYRTSYVDYYRYNRSYSLRHVERQFHDTSNTQPIRLTFPGRVLDAAHDDNFISDKLALTSEFFGTFSAGEGQRVIYTTDSRGRILTQTMLNDKDEELWVIVNTWSGDRIVAMQRREGKDEKVTEYEYDDAGDRVVQRDINNGVLERLVRIDGENETEELYLDGILVLKAYWVNGRKISEERVRRR